MSLPFTYRRSPGIKISAMALAGIGLAVIAFVSAPVSGAWFSDSKTGALTASTGSLLLSAPGRPETIDFSFGQIMPGAFASQSVTLQNTGTTSGGVRLQLANMVHDGIQRDMSKLHYEVEANGRVTMLDANGGAADLGTLMPGDSNVVTVSVVLDESAGNDWQNAAIDDSLVFVLAQ